MTADRLSKRLRLRNAVEKADAPLTPLLALQQETTRTDAATLIALYRQQGATDEQVARAWELWRESMAASVTTIGADR